jgi:hypothetical protein
MIAEGELPQRLVVRRQEDLEISAAEHKQCYVTSTMLVDSDH